MRRIYVLVAVAAAVAALTVLATGCEKDTKNKRLDPNATISLRADKTAFKSELDVRAGEGHLTARQIVELTGAVWFTNKTMYPDSYLLERGFTDAQRDLVNERLLMFGYDIISSMGVYEPIFIEGENVVLVRVVGEYPLVIDTIAYIPNRVLRTAQPLIKAAYDREDYATVYKLFDEAFTFRPITGAEYRELEAKGEN